MISKRSVAAKNSFNSIHSLILMLMNIMMRWYVSNVRCTEAITTQTIIKEKKKSWEMKVLRNSSEHYWVSISHRRQFRQSTFIEMQTMIDNHDAINSWIYLSLPGLISLMMKNKITIFVSQKIWEISLFNYWKCGKSSDANDTI